MAGGALPRPSGPKRFDAEQEKEDSHDAASESEAVEPAADPDRTAKVFEVSEEEAARFVQAVGGVRRLRTLLGGVVAEDVDAAQAATPAAFAAALGEAAASAREPPGDGAVGGAEGPAALGAGVDMEEDEHGEPSAAEPGGGGQGDDDDSESVEEEDDPESPARMGRRKRQKKKSKRRKKRKSPTTTTAAPQAAAAAPPRAVALPSTKTSKVKDDLGIHTHMVGLYDQFKKLFGIAAKNEDMFVMFCHDMAAMDEVRGSLALWLEMDIAKAFCQKELGIDKGNIQILQTFASVAVQQAAAESRPIGASPPAAAQSEPASPFTFSIPPMVDTKRTMFAHVQAHVLIKAGKFFTSCVDSGTVRELRFRSRVERDGKVLLEARFLGSNEKYPVLQPWVVYEERADIMFFGSRGRVISEYRRDFISPLERIGHDPVKLPGGRLFRVVMRFGEPVLLIRTVGGDGSRVTCAGATTIHRLQEYSAEWEDQAPKDMEPYVQYLESAAV